MKIVVLVLVLLLNSYAYQTQEKLKAVIIGKVAKFITWENNKEDKFVITVLDDPFARLLSDLYKNIKIRSKEVQVVSINDINDLNFTNILYIPASDASKLSQILQKIKNKNILTVSDIRGFAEKEGIIQIYFVAQKPKLKINLESAKKEHLQIKSSLLRIAEVIQKGEE